MAKKFYEIQPNETVVRAEDVADAFSQSISYSADSWVSYNGGVYLCKKQTTAGIPPSNTEYWTDMTKVSARFSNMNTSLTSTVQALIDSSIDAPNATLAAALGGE